MKLFKQLDDGFSALRLRDRVIAVATVAAVLALGGNLVLLKPQQQAINSLQAKQSAHQKELGALRKLLAEIRSEVDRGVDPFADQRAQLAELQRTVADTATFLGHDDPTSSQIGSLVRGLIQANPGLTLVSLKTRPGAVFYTPPAPPAPPKGQLQDGAIADILGVLKKEETKAAPPPVVLVKKPLHKHGVDVVVKGGYAALLSYMEEMQKFPKRIFWSEVHLDATNHREATLKFLVYTLSDQATPALN